MSWVQVGIAGGTALLSNQQARQQQKQQKAQNMVAATQTEYSPWTGMGQGQMQTGAPDPTAATLQGGLTGFMQGQNVNKGMAETEALKKKTFTNPTGSTDPMGSYASSMYGKIGE